MTQWLVDGLIPIGDSVLLVGEPHSMKTWVAGSLAISIATGLPFLDELIVKQQFVIYINEDAPINITDERFERLAKGFGTTMANLDNLMLKNRVGFRIFRNADIEELQLISTIQPTTIVLDSLPSVAPGKGLDKTQDATAVTERWNNLKQNNTTVIILHHASLKKSAEPDMARKALGNTELVAQCDTLLGISRGQTPETTATIVPTNRRTLLTVEKLNIGIKEPKDHSWAKLFLLDEAPIRPTDVAKRILPYFIKDNVTSAVVNEIIKFCGGAYKDVAVRDALKELEDHKVLIRMIDLGKMNRFRYKVNPDFNNGHAVTSDYWDEIRQ